MTTMAFSGTMEVKRPSIFGHRWRALHGELAAAAGGGVELRLFAQAGDAAPARAAFRVARATDVPRSGRKRRHRVDLHGGAGAGLLLGSAAEAALGRRRRAGDLLRRIARSKCS
jgi:hypothetical protein